MRVQPSNILFSSRASLGFVLFDVKIQLDRSRSIQVVEQTFPSVSLLTKQDRQACVSYTKRHPSLRIDSIREHNLFLEANFVRLYFPQISSRNPLKHGISDFYAPGF